MRYTAESYSVMLSTRPDHETGYCVKLGDDTILDVYVGGMEMAQKIADLLNQDRIFSVRDSLIGMEHAP